MEHDHMIRIDYKSLTDGPLGEVDPALVRKAKGFWGRRARREILRVMDQLVRVQAVQVSQRAINPQLLYEAGQSALRDAIKAYQVGQRESFRDFATLMIRQAMTHTKEKIAPSPAALDPKVQL
jgi:DNA-directed RNA polymerase specialized sigma subunit